MSCLRLCYLVFAFICTLLVKQGTGKTAPIEQPQTALANFLKNENMNLNSGLLSFMKRARPTPGTAPLDPNEAIHSELDTLNKVLGITGGAGSGLVQGLTGVGITDCASQIKGQDLNTLSCGEFLNQLSKCDSLMNVKSLLQAARKQKKTNKNSKKPCFQ